MMLTCYNTGGIDYQLYLTTVVCVVECFSDDGSMPTVHDAANMFVERLDELNLSIDLRQPVIVIAGHVLGEYREDAEEYEVNLILAMTPRDYNFLTVDDELDWEIEPYDPATP